MNGVQTRFKCKLDVKRCKRFVFPPSSLLPRSNALKTKAIRYFQTDRTLTRIVSPPLNTSDEVTNEYIKYGKHLLELIQKGFSAAVYTQTTDVEGEINGLMTYDRKVIKMNEAKVREINQQICNSLNK